MFLLFIQLDNACSLSLPLIIQLLIIQITSPISMQWHKSKFLRNTCFSFGSPCFSGIKISTPRSVSISLDSVIILIGVTIQIWAELKCSHHIGRSEMPNISNCVWFKVMFTEKDGFSDILDSISWVLLGCLLMETMK